MQERLVVLVRSVEILNKPHKARTIESTECVLDVNPGWRNLFLLGHDLDLSVVNWDCLTRSFKIHEFGDSLPAGIGQCAFHWTSCTNRKRRVGHQARTAWAMSVVFVMSANESGLPRTPERLRRRS